LEPTLNTRQLNGSNAPCAVPIGVAKNADAASAASIHLRLKLATRPDHDRVDRSLSRFDLANLADYAAFLILNAAALSALRPHWRSEDDADFGGLVEALAVDLAELGAAMPSPGRTSGSIDGLGLAYVVRGSRLGSKILRKRVGPGFPTAYLDFKPATSWNELLRQLDQCDPAEPGFEQASIAGARATFALYQRLARPERAAA
jgi:heme oxygenase (biliverdin-IX-beta and delta-forming)